MKQAKVGGGVYGWSTEGSACAVSSTLPKKGHLKLLGPGAVGIARVHVVDAHKHHSNGGAVHSQGHIEGLDGAELTRMAVAGVGDKNTGEGSYHGMKPSAL